MNCILPLLHQFDVSKLWRKIVTPVKKQPRRLNVERSVEIIEALGGTVSVAEICGRAPSSISDWKSKGIPRSFVLYLRERFKRSPFMKNDEIRNF